MNLSELRETVAEAIELDVVLKEGATKLKRLKARILREARGRELGKVVCDVGEALIVPKTTTTANVPLFRALLRDMGRDDEFCTLVKVNITEARKRIGDRLAPCLTENTNEYGSVRLKEC